MQGACLFLRSAQLHAAGRLTPATWAPGQDMQCSERRFQLLGACQDGSTAATAQQQAWQHWRSARLACCMTKRPAGSSMG